MDANDTNQSINSPETPSQPIQYPVNNQRGNFLIILGALVLLLVVGGGAYYLGTQNSGKTTQFQNSNTQSATNPTASPVATQPSQVSETSSWEIYMNVKHGYEIKYPKFLMHEAGTYQGMGGEVATDSWTPQTKNYSINVYSYEEGVNTKLEFNAKTEADETILVAGQKVRKLSGTEIISDRGTLIHVGPLKNKGVNYMFIFTSGSQKATVNDLTTFDQMLSTFKFAN